MEPKLLMRADLTPDRSLSVQIEVTDSQYQVFIQGETCVAHVKIFPLDDGLDAIAYYKELFIGWGTKYA